MQLKQQAVVFFVFVFALSSALLFLERALAIIFLGAAFIFLAPFMVLERASIPFLRKTVFGAVLAGIVSAFIGGLCWNVAMLL